MRVHGPGERLLRAMVMLRRILRNATGVATMVVALAVLGSIVGLDDVAPAAPPTRADPRSSGEISGGFLRERSPVLDKSLEDLRAGLRSPWTRKATIDLLLRSGRDAAPRLHELLHRRTRVSASAYKSLLRRIGAHVPDSRGRFSGTPPKPSLDWLEALAQLADEGPAERLAAAHREALLSVALMRALAASEHHDAALSLLRFAYRHGGAFRDECGRQIRSMRVHAVPGLVRARALRDPLAYKMRRYAAYQLDRIDYTRPGRVLKRALPDLRAELLHAYGEVRDPAAVRAVLRYVDVDSTKVRRSARWAMLRYVSGRRPKVKKRRLKLAGGRTTEHARALYYTYRQLAFHALAREVAVETAKDNPRVSADDLEQKLKQEADARHLAERLFARLDRRREKVEARRLAGALKLARAGKLSQGLRRMDIVLARDPFHPRRAEMAPFYYRRARQLLEQGAPERAAALFTKALHLAPSASFADQARGRRALAEAASRHTLDSAREWKLRMALAWAPDLTQAREMLAEVEARQARRLWLAAGVGGLVSLLLVLGLVYIRRRIL